MAVQLVETGGHETLSLRAVASEVGVKASSLYNHFENRQALLAEVAAIGFESFTSEMTTVFAKDPSLSTAIRAYLNFALTRPNIFKLMFSVHAARKDAYPSLKVAAANAFMTLSSCVATPNDSSPDGAVAAWSMMHGAALLVLDEQLGRIRNGDMTIEDLAKRLALVLEHGLAEGCATRQ